MYGMVIFSFAQRDANLEPGPSNTDLACAAARIIDKVHHELEESVLIVSQWEPAIELKGLGVVPHLEVKLRKDGTYLDSQGVWNDAKQLLNKHGITQVIPVAQPFLHLPFGIRPMIEGDGFTIIDMEIGKIRFDKDKRNHQWWTRSRWQLFIYSVMKKLGYQGGHGGKQYKV